MSISAYGTEDELPTHYLQEHDKHFIAFLMQKVIFKRKSG